MKKLAKVNKHKQTRRACQLVQVIEVLPPAMGEAKACLWVTVVVRLKAVALAASNSHLQWRPTMLELTQQDSKQIFSDEVARMAMVERLHGISTAIGDNKAVISHKCRSSSHLWATLARIRTSTPMSSSLAIELEGL